MKFLKTTIVAFFGICLSLSAQELQQPLEEVPMSNRGYALLKTGEVIEGKILTTTSTRGITKVKLEDEFGESHTISAENIHEFAVAMNGAVRLQYAMERGSSVKKLLTKNQPTAKPEDFIVFRNTSLNGENELLLQLLNPGFDDVFEVFYDPFARKTTALGGEYITWTGDKHRAFFVSKNGGPLIKVKNGNYKDEFANLFGDCDQLTSIKKPRLEDLGQHIALYSASCSFQN
ncbi:hypothetical protein J0A67_08075 [Algoriphagus aestuariicola]|uniref:Uncharacterized protein n=1 Tax=Algoriphagus aestuariicola TaxID=1852016 RepID=A0ABS3BNS2_9BACT|nr:hypothetical protein [Algoriphagus aestuariicola]MBN7800813.1 hypothetical protein [Algoriphagus aestuariicola]